VKEITGVHLSKWLDFFSDLESKSVFGLLPATMDREAIDERIRVFAESVRDETMEDFKPGKSWWFLNHTKASLDNFPNSVSLLDQLDITVQDMESLFGRYWTGHIGNEVYSDYLRLGKLGRCILVTVRSDDDKNLKNTSPLDSNSKIVGVAAANTRYPPWVLLKENLLPS